ncbi:Neuronal Cell Adhesion Molecule [Manis pentadactyla]|nr:Neuronal Cell Adhesion Molecule [Manis pentadactyla]
MRLEQADPWSLGNGFSEFLDEELDSRLVSLASTFPSVQFNRPLLSSCAKEGAGLAFLKWMDEKFSWCQR